MSWTIKVIHNIVKQSWVFAHEKKTLGSEIMFLLETLLQSTKCAKQTKKSLDRTIINYFVPKMRIELF